MLLMSVLISVKISSNIPGYVSSFISTLFMKVHHFFWVDWMACSMDVMSFVFVFVGFLCRNFCYKEVLGFCEFFVYLSLFSWGYLFMLLIRDSIDMAFIRLAGKRNM